MPSAFENLCGAGKPLREEPPDPAEFAGLLRSGLARLNDAARSSWRSKVVSTWATTRLTP